jgi:uncharacterized protein (TIGR02594 family)
VSIDYTSRFLSLNLDYSNCPWLQYAANEAQANVREVVGSGSNPRVVEYLRTVGFSDDATPWCSGFVNWCMTQASIAGTNRANARSWLQWGVPIVDCRLGAIAVFTRGSSPAQGHVGFYVGLEGSNILVLGGNQSNAVNVKPYAQSRLLSFRWPA